MVWTLFVAQSPGASTAVGIRCTNATYLTARSGGGTKALQTTGTLSRLDQDFSSGSYRCFQQFLSFDTSSVSTLPRAARLEIAPDPSSGDVSIGVGTDLGFVEAYVKDYGADVDTTDWVDGGTLSIANRVAYIEAQRFTDKNPAASDQRLIALNSEGLASAVTLSGTTKLMVCTSSFRLATVPASVVSNFFVVGWDALGGGLAPRLWLDIGDPHVDRPVYI